MSLYHKYRPQKFSHIHGNKEVVEALKNMVADINSCPHSLLFHGPKGNGKTTMARLIAKNIGVAGKDLRELDTADFRGIDSIREIRKQAQYKPLESDRRMWILDEAHQLTKDAQNALLKIFEDTPDHVYFAICTTDPQKLLPTLRDRCHTFEVQPLKEKEMAKLLVKICKAEKEQVQKKVIMQIVRDTQGHPREALQILDQVLRVEPKNRLKLAKRKAEQQNQSIQLCRSLISREPWSKTRNILSGLKDENPESVRRHVLGYAQSVVLNGDNEQAGAILEEFIHPFYDSGFPGLVYACYVISKS